MENEYQTNNIVEECARGRRDGFSGRPYEPGGEPRSKVFVTLDLNRDFRPGEPSYRAGYLLGQDERQALPITQRLRLAFAWLTFRELGA